MIRPGNAHAARLSWVLLVALLGLATTGCDLLKPTPSASPAAAASAAAKTPAPSASVVSEAELEAHRHVLALIKAFRSDPLVAHVVQSATTTATQGTTSVKATAAMTLDLSGRDLKANMVVTSAGKTSKSYLVVLGKSAYAKADSGAWKKAPRNGLEKTVSDLIASLRLVDDVTALRYVGVETVEKRQLHHLTAARTIPYTASNGAAGQYDTFDVWTADDGTPVLVKATFSAKLGSVSVKGTTQFRFMQFGGPIKIVAPKTK